MSSARRARDDDHPKAPSGTRAPKGIGNSVKLMFSTTATASSMRVETRALRRPPSPSVSLGLPRGNRLGKGKYVSARPVAARGLPG